MYSTSLLPHWYVHIIVSLNIIIANLSRIDCYLMDLVHLTMLTSSANTELYNNMLFSPKIPKA